MPKPKKPAKITLLNATTLLTATTALYSNGVRP